MGFAVLVSSLESPENVLDGMERRKHGQTVSGDIPTDRRRNPARSAPRMNADGVLSKSPGLRHQALPWVGHPLNGSTPKGLRRPACVRPGRNPVGVRWHRVEPTQGRRSFLAPTLGFEPERRWRSWTSAAVLRDQIAEPSIRPKKEERGQAVGQGRGWSTRSPSLVTGTLAWADNAMKRRRKSDAPH